METSREYVFESPIHLLLLRRLTTSKGQHPNRQQRPRLHIRLQSAHNHLESADLLIYVHGWWDNSVDESGAPRPGRFWFGEESPD